jgi:hypothetical protein
VRTQATGTNSGTTCSKAVRSREGYFTEQTTSAATALPAVSVTVSAVARQLPGLLVSWPMLPVTVYVPTGSVAAYLPSGPTVTCRETGPSMSSDPETARADPGAGPPTSIRRPVSVALSAADGVGVGVGGCRDVHAAARLVAARLSTTRRTMATTIRR